MFLPFGVLANTGLCRVAFWFPVGFGSVLGGVIGDCGWVSTGVISSRSRCRCLFQVIIVVRFGIP